MMQNLDHEWILEQSRITGFSVPAIHQLIELCYLREEQPPNLLSRVEQLISSLRTPQKWFSIRINPVRYNTLTKSKQKHLMEKLQIKPLEILSNLRFLPVEGPYSLKKHPRIITVDKFAAESMMTGANLYIPGFLRPLPKFLKGEKFSIYGPNQIHVANGITQYSHKEILDMKNGIGIKTTESLYKIPPYRESEYYKNGFLSDHSFGPLLACNLALEFYREKENQTIFDLCSAPGHKTCALSEIGFHRCGTFPNIVSIDRSKTRLVALRDDISRLGLQNIHIIPQKIEKLLNFNPELINTADIVILDPPCSALGTRPKLSITHTKEDFRSFFLLQRRLVKEAVRFLKKGGILLYTTCTLTALENEGIVSILVKSLDFDLLNAKQLLRSTIKPRIYKIIQNEISSGIARNENFIQTLPFTDLSHQEDLSRYLILNQEEAKKLIRLLPMGDHSTGYFIALLRKKTE